MRIFNKNFKSRCFGENANYSVWHTVLKINFFLKIHHHCEKQPYFNKYVLNKKFSKVNYLILENELKKCIEKHQWRTYILLFFPNFFSFRYCLYCDSGNYGNRKLILRNKDIKRKWQLNKEIHNVVGYN